MYVSLITISQLKYLNLNTIINNIFFMCILYSIPYNLVGNICFYTFIFIKPLMYL